MTKRIVKSIQSIKEKYVLPYTIEELYELKQMETKEFNTFFKRYYNYRIKYTSNVRYEDFNKIKELFLNFIKREKTNKITLNNFLLIGLGQKEYDKYCKLKTNKIANMSISFTKKDYIMKYGEKRAEEICKSKITTSLEYFLKKANGDLEKARKMLKERQSTFTLEKCIKKYGEEGYKIWKDRQEKWQETLKNKSDKDKIEINKKKNTFIKRKDESLDDFFTRCYKSINKRENRREEIKTKEDYIRFKIKEYKKPLCSSTLKPEDFYNNSGSLLRNLINREDFIFMIKDFYKPNKFYKAPMGVMTKVSEGTLRSYLEYKVYNVLKERNIKIEIGKKYPNIRMFSDFYLPEFNIYIEVAGLMEDENYKKKMEFKHKHFNSIILEPNDIEFFNENYSSEILNQIGKLPHLLNF